MVFSKIIYLLLFIRVSHTLNNGLGRTPQMGNKPTLLFHENSLIYFF